MPFCSDDDLTDAAQAANTLRAAPLPDHWVRIVPRANLRAYNRLQAVALGRGFTPAQFAAWGSGASSHGYDWNLRLGVVFAFLEASKSDEDRGAAYREELKELLEELTTLDFVIGGEQASPEGSGRVNHGDYDTGSDRVVLSEPDGSGDFEVGEGTTL